MGILFKNLHWFIILYAIWIGYGAYEATGEKEEMLRGQVAAQERQYRKAKRDRKQLKGYFKDVDTAKQRINQVALEVKNVQKKLPDKIDDVANLETFDRIVKKLNIINPTARPVVEDNKGFYFEKKYGVAGKGTFLQFVVALEKINLLEGLFNIRRVALKTDLSSKRGRFQILNGEFDIIAYRYNVENEGKDLGIKAKNKK